MWQILALFLIPFGIIYLTPKIKLFEWLGPVGVCYAVGLLLANLPWFHFDSKIGMQVSEFCVPMAICLLLFATDLKSWLKESKATIISFGLMIVAVSVGSISVSYFFSDKLPEISKLAAMMVGVYIGGTVNLSAIGLALGVSEKSFFLLNATDVFIGGFYFLFLISFGARWMAGLLKPYPNPEDFVVEEKTETKGELRKQLTKEAPALILLGLGGLVISYFLTQLIFGALTVGWFLMFTTTYALILAGFPWLRKFTMSYEVGHYFLLVFCLSMGSMAKASELVDGSEVYFIYVLLVLTASALIHMLLCASFKIDGHTAVITSVAGIYGPAFIPPVAAKLRNKKMLIAGITTGLVGYAVGNYCGFFVVYLMEKILN
ncbi:MAG: DUF819 family protein [Bacteriovoracaceae bacterium]|nr:DUF819 family protein [Bacteriovoracaceae bacterium]